MKAITLWATVTRAEVLMRPCWLCRFLGARESVLELEWRDGTHGPGWYAITSRRPLRDLWHNEKIRDALDFRSRGELPTARATTIGAIR